MKIIIAPQAFKGSLQAHEAARAMGEGVKAIDPDIQVVLLPIADGGSGTVRAMVEAASGKLVTTDVHGPLGEKVAASWAMLDGGTTAVIEMAAASGLSLVPESSFDPMKTSTGGTGELIKTALEAGCRKIIVGLGDSATVDGGTGMARALGVRFLDENGDDIPEGGGGLEKLAHIDVSGRHPLLHGSEVLCACDVTNTLYGPEGAAPVYGPQKGATPEMVRRLDAALRRYAEIIISDTGKDIGRLPGG
ncbi:MAG: glycerate kinase, partial [Dehalococcoidales bacterium]|nr:glycerate kinase [Dehalococcoidales bacterium]